MHRIFKHSWILVFTCLMLFCSLSGCGRKNNEQGSAPKPAEVENPVKESTLTTIRLTAEAEERLGIETAIAESGNMPKILQLGGEVVVPPGQQVGVTAPISGMVLRTGGGYFPVAGSRVNMKQEVMRLLLIPPEMDILSAEEDVRVKELEFEAARAELIRAGKLLENKAISDKAMEATRASFARAEASLNAARGRLNLYQGKELDSATENLSTFTIESPIRGVIQGIGVTPGQIIAAASFLFEVSPMNRFWIRVPVYSGDLAAIDIEKIAMVSTMGENEGSGLLQANPIQGPLVSSASSASSYIYYGIDDAGGALRSGQKVSVTLSMKSTGEYLMVPYSALIYDIQGGTWVYVKSGPLVYKRTRVELSHVLDRMAVLTRGVIPGDTVVFAGAAELFGTEFGVGK